MAYYIIYSYNYVYNIYVIAWIISGILILSVSLLVSLYATNKCYKDTSCALSVDKSGLEWLV